jgi:hypothetical protein
VSEISPLGEPEEEDELDEVPEDEFDDPVESEEEPLELEEADEPPFDEEAPEEAELPSPDEAPADWLSPALDSEDPPTLEQEQETVPAMVRASKAATTNFFVFLFMGFSLFGDGIE